MRASLVGAAVLVSAAVMCGTAGAASYCVPAHAGCTGTGEPSLEAAVTDANATVAADDIYLDTGVFAGGVTVGSFPVHIHGAGEDRTKIEGGGGAYGVYMGQPESSIDNLTIHELAGGHQVGLYLAGSAQRVVVDLRDDLTSSTVAVSMHGEASFEDGAALAALSPVPVTSGISATASGPMLISNVQAQGGYGMALYDTGPITVRFASVIGQVYGIINQSASALVDDSVVSGAPVIGDLAGGAGDITTTLRHVTLNGTYVDAQSDGHVSKVVLSNTAIVGGGPDPETPDIKLTQFASGTARVEADYSFFRAAHVIYTAGPGVEYVPGAHNVDGADARLVDSSGPDLRPRFDSPLVDTGDPVPGGGEPMADLAGEFRAVNGRTDIGAYEYGRHAPTVSAVATPAAALVGDAVQFTAGPGDVDPGERPTVTWTFDDGTPPVTGAIVTHTFATAGPHVATATATDPVGLTAVSAVAIPISAAVVPPKASAPSFGFKRLKARKGVVGVLLSCPLKATDCTGTVELRLAPKGRVLLGKARYVIAHGGHRNIRVKLSRGARRRLAAARRGLRVKVVVKPKDARSRSKTVVLKRR